MAPPILFSWGVAPQSAVSADFNKDGHLDIVATNYYANTVSIVLGIGNGSFQTPSISFPTAGSHAYWLATHDFNADGNLDLALNNEGSNTVSILFGLGNGSFQLPAQTFPSGGPVPSPIIATDLNNDNKIDLVVANTGAHNITVFLGFLDNLIQLAHYLRL
jgi:hypothetical protein